VTNEQRVKTLFTEANPIPDVDSFAVDEIGGTAYLATLEQWRSEMTQLDTRSIEKKKPQRGRLVLVLGAAAAAILVGGVIALTGDQTGDTSASAAQPATVTSEVIRASEVLLGRTPSSMEATIQADALLTVDRSAYDSNLPERFDIVLYADVYMTSSPDLVTRVVGLPGETIEGRDGSVYVNGRLLDEPYLKNPDIPHPPFGPIMLGADELWLMGQLETVCTAEPSPSHCCEGRSQTSPILEPRSAACN